jgi:hypothetical protein
MHELKHPDVHEENEEGEMIGQEKPPGWMFDGHMCFVLCSPRVERDLDNSKVSASFSTGDEDLKGAKGSHGGAAAKKRLKLNDDAARTSKIAQATSLGGGRGMDMKLQLGSGMLCAQLGQLNNQKKRMQAETVGGLLNCAQQEKQGCIELLKTFDKNAEEWDEAREDFKKAKSGVDQLAGLVATLNDGKRTADEEITDDFVNSLRKRPAVATLHQPTQETVTQEGRLSQMVDFQELENLKEAHDAASEASSIHEKPSSVASSPSSAASTVVPMSTSTQAAASGPSAADATNKSFPHCGAGKHCAMPHFALDKGCYDCNGNPKHRCAKCKRVLHGGLCGTGEGTQLACFLCLINK